MSGNKEFTEQHQKTLKDHLRGCCDLGNRPELIERCEQIAGNCKGPNPNLCNKNGNCDDKPKDNNCGGCPPAQEQAKQDCDSCAEQQKNNKAKCPAPFPKK